VLVSPKYWRYVSFVLCWQRINLHRLWIQLKTDNISNFCDNYCNEVAEITFLRPLLGFKYLDYKYKTDFEAKIQRKVWENRENILNLCTENYCRNLYCVLGGTEQQIQIVSGRERMTDCCMRVDGVGYIKLNNQLAQEEDKLPLHFTSFKHFNVP
jgi:hypothetical protein